METETNSVTVTLGSQKLSPCFSHHVQAAYSSGFFLCCHYQNESIKTE